MIPALLALGVGALIVMACWDDIVDWLRSFTRKVKNFFRNIGHAAKIFAQKVRGHIMQVIHRVFFKENNQWYQETTRVEVEESEVPEWAKAGVAASEKDVTEKYRQKLSLTL